MFGGFYSIERRYPDQQGGLLHDPRGELRFSDSEATLRLRCRMLVKRFNKATFRTHDNNENDSIIPSRNRRLCAAESAHTRTRRFLQAFPLFCRCLLITCASQLGTNMHCGRLTVDRDTRISLATYHCSAAPRQLSPRTLRYF